MTNTFQFLRGALGFAIALVSASVHAQSTSVGREATAPWRAPALARIEQLRKGDFTLRAGEPPLVVDVKLP